MDYKRIGITTCHRSRNAVLPWAPCLGSSRDESRANSTGHQSRLQPLHILTARRACTLNSQLVLAGGCLSGGEVTCGGPWAYISTCMSRTCSHGQCRRLPTPQAESCLAVATVFTLSRYGTCTRATYARSSSLSSHAIRKSICKAPCQNATCRTNSTQWVKRHRNHARTRNVRKGTHSCPLSCVPAHSNLQQTVGTKKIPVRAYVYDCMCRSA